MNESLNMHYLKSSSNTLLSIDHYEDPILLNKNIPFILSSEFIADVNIGRDQNVDLDVDYFMSSCLDKITNGKHEATTCFNTTKMLSTRSSTQRR